MPTLKRPKKTTRLSGVAAYGDFGRGALATHSLTAIDQVVREVVDACATQWKWSPGGLLILNHPPARAAGRAWDPGSGPRRGERIISIGRDILQEYDLTSIGRIVAHELCHHYREEAWPRDLSRYGTMLRKLKVHDERFCEALGLIDPIVRESPVDCRQFNDERWIGGATARKGAQLNVREVSAILKHLKSGDFRLVIVDFSGRKPKQVKSLPLGAEHVGEFVAGAGWSGQDLDLIPLDADDRAGRSGLWDITVRVSTTSKPRVLDLLKTLAVAYPTHGFVELLDRLGVPRRAS